MRTVRCPPPSIPNAASGDVATVKQPCGAMFWNDGEASAATRLGGREERRGALRACPQVPIDVYP